MRGSAPTPPSGEGEGHLQCELSGARPCFPTCEPLVPFAGPHPAKLMFIGERGGKRELIMGEPFVGRSGQLLTRLLTEAGIDRATCRISNTVRCYATGNRPPSAVEIGACKSHLWCDIVATRPKVIIPLGSVPTKLLLKVPSSKFKMEEWVGKPTTVSWYPATIFPLFHPSYLLRHGGKLNAECVRHLKRAKDLADADQSELLSGT